MKQKKKTRKLSLSRYIEVGFMGFILLCAAAMISACASTPKGPSLSDLKSRYWQGTYYLSLKQSPKSIKCELSEHYKTPGDVPVTFKGKDATAIFMGQENQHKIVLLQRQCFEKSKSLFQ